MQRRKRRSKYDVSRIYEGSKSKPYFFAQPGQSSFYDAGHKKKLDTNDPSLNLRPQKDRTVFNIEQMLILEKAFQMDKHPSNEIRECVANLANLPLERVRIWYQNRRAKEKRDEEDRLAMLADKLMENSTSNYSKEPYICRAAINKKLEHLDEMFVKDKSYQNPSHSKQNHRIQHNNPYFTNSRNNNSNQTIDDTNELECVKNLLRSETPNGYTVQQNRKSNKTLLPGIGALSKQLAQGDESWRYFEDSYTTTSKSNQELPKNLSKHNFNDENECMQRLTKSDGFYENQFTIPLRHFTEQQHQNSLELVNRIIKMEDSYQPLSNLSYHDPFCHGQIGNDYDACHEEYYDEEQKMVTEEMNILNLLHQRRLLEELQQTLQTSIHQQNHAFNIQMQGQSIRENHTRSRIDHQNIIYLSQNEGLEQSSGVRNFDKSSSPIKWSSEKSQQLNKKSHIKNFSS